MKRDWMKTLSTSNFNKRLFTPYFICLKKLLNFSEKQ